MSYPPASSSSSASSSRNLALPGFHDFSAFASPHAHDHRQQHSSHQIQLQQQREYDPGIGSSRHPPPTHRFDNQHFMSEVNSAAHASTNGAAGPHDALSPHHPPMTSDPAFDILDWYPAYQSCQRYFLDVAQHEPGTQALAALINIRLPFQYLSRPITTSSPPANSTGASPANGTQSSSNPTYQFTFTSAPPPSSSSRQPPHISLIPYLRRLVITGFDKPAILHGFFGDDYARGVLPHLDCERRNYLFAAKHGGWGTCKAQYDAGSGVDGAGDETVPFMKPLDGAREEELLAAEKAWGKWLAMEDWMVGPNAPREGNGAWRRDGGAAEGLPDGVAEAFERGR